ncbi:MAG: hypothetical protein J6N53_00820 [Lachnospiraceae bacterium]|nr:hypothetical protein [Lachnospiraceae bacterium]MCR5128084.1 hypothetical protein [Lachnospiraceae bacterium]
MQTNVLTNRGVSKDFMTIVVFVNGIVWGGISFISGIVGVVFFVVGRIFVANPEGGTMTVNGQVLEGEEAIEAACKLGNTFSVIGIVLVIVAVVLLVVSLVLFRVYSIRKKQL